MLVSLQGTAATIEKALFVNLNYKSRPDGTQFYAPDREPSLNLEPTVLRVSGLENYDVPTPNVSPSDPRLYPGDLRDAFASCHSGLMGAGQTIAMLSYSAYDSNQLQHYRNYIHYIPASDFGVVSMVPVDGASTIPDGAGKQTEAQLDVQMAMAVAPSANIVMYVLNQDVASTNHGFAKIATTKPLAWQVSSSWGLYNDSLTQQLVDQLAAQGQSFLLASGDSGAYDVTTSSLSLNMNNITLVGGTTPVLNTAKTAIDHEEAWSGSGGGVLKTVPLPYYQVGIPGLGSSTNRSYPDVAAFGDGVAFFGLSPSNPQTGSGTSVSTPLWAGFIALVNSASANPVGFINPAIYYIAQSSDYANMFNDIEIGENPSKTSKPPGNPTYSAKKNYDLVTGWGSPKCGLIDKLATPCAPSNTDPHNCGACWHECQGGACVGGVCQPLALTSDQNVGPLTADNSSVYWGSGSTVSKVPVNGGVSTVITSSEIEVDLIAINRSSVFWHDAGTLAFRQQDFGSSTPTTIIPGFEYPCDMAVSEQQIYWSDCLQKKIYTAKFTDYAKTAMATTSGEPMAIKLDTINLYWAEWGPTTITIWKMPKGGGTPVQIGSGPAYGVAEYVAMGIDASNVYWVDSGDGGPDGPALRKVPIAGGPTTVLARFSSSCPSCVTMSLAVDGAAYVAWSDSGQPPNSATVFKIPLDGGTKVTMVTGLTNWGVVLKANSSAFFYTTGDFRGPGPIMKLAK